MMGLRWPKSHGETLGWALAAYLLGIAAHSITPYTRVDVVFWVPAIAVTVIIWIATSHSRKFLVIWLLLVAALFGFWRFDATIPTRQDGVLPWLYGFARISGRVESISTSSRSPTAVIEARDVNGKRIAGQARHVSINAAISGLKVGSPIVVACKLRQPYTFVSSIDRRITLAKKDIWAECSAPTDIVSFDPPPRIDVMSWFADLREFFSARIGRVLPHDEATLLTGILYGDQDFSSEQKDLFQRAGLMHLVAVSGSNVTILADILLPIALWFGMRRRGAFFFLSFCLVGFVAFVGFGASVARAAFMGWLMHLGRQVGRVAWTDRLLLFAAVSLNMLNPRLLVFDAGFALSFLATWGLMAWSPLICARLKFVPRVLGLREIVGTTCGATLMTAPYLAWAFGRMSLAGLITNLLALPLVPWTMLWGALAAVWGDMVGYVFVSLPVSGLLRLIMLSARLADVFPWLDIKTEGLDFYLMLACYLLIWRLWRLFADDKDLSTKISTRGVDCQCLMTEKTGTETRYNPYS